MNYTKIIARLFIVIAISGLVFTFVIVPLHDKSVAMEFKDYVQTSDIDGLALFLSSKKYDYNKLLLTHMPEWSPFEHVVEKKETGKINLLLRYGISPQFANLHEEEMVYFNSEIIKSPQLLQSLLEYGLEINPSTKDNNRKIIVPPLYVAIRNLFAGIGKYGEFKNIQSRKYYKSIVSPDNWSSYHNERHAEDAAILKSIKLLLDNCADVNRGIVSETRNIAPLMEACRKGRVDIINLLLNSGADPYIDDNGVFALDICYLTKAFVNEEERQKAIQLLVEEMQK